MKKIFYIVIVASVVFVSFKAYKIYGLFEQTDYFVEQLHTTYSTYGLHGVKHTRYTNDGKFKITPTFRLINVRIEREAGDTEYEILRKCLEIYYSNDDRVNDVYICGYGTIMIDCRSGS